MSEKLIKARADKLAALIARYAAEAEAVHGEIDKADGDIWDLLAYKAALELWGGNFNGGILYFKNEDHDFRYAQWETKIPKNNVEYQAAIYCLAATGEPIQKYISRGGISFPALFEEADKWGSGERALIHLAAHLFNGSGKMGIAEIFSPLDEENRKVAIKALELRYHIKEG